MSVCLSLITTRQMSLVLSFPLSFYVSLSIYLSVCLSHRLFLALTRSLVIYIYTSDYISIYLSTSISLSLFLSLGAPMVQWQRWLSDRSCAWGMIHNKLHFIRPGCPRPRITLQCRDRGLKHQSYHFSTFLSLSLPR